MQFKIKTLYDLNEGLGDLIDKELPVTVSFMVSRNFNKILAELKIAEEQRKKIADKDDKDQADKEFKELLEQEVNVDVQTINISNIGNVRVKPRTLSLLTEILKEESDDE